MAEPPLPEAAMPSEAGRISCQLPNPPGSSTSLWCPKRGRGLLGPTPGCPGGLREVLVLVTVNQGTALGKFILDLYCWTFSTLRFTFPVLVLFFGQPRGVGMSEAIPSSVCDPFCGQHHPRDHQGPGAVPGISPQHLT